MNLTKEEQEKLLQAEQKFTVGMKFYSFTDRSEKIVRGFPFYGIDKSCIIIPVSGWDYCVIYKGQWAEIIPSEPLTGGELSTKEVDEINLSHEVEHLKSDVARLEAELKEILKISVEQIYFNDSADYLTAHYMIAHKLRPDIQDFDPEIVRDLYRSLQ